MLAVTQATAETVALRPGLGSSSTVVDALDGGPLDLPYFRMKSKLMTDGEFPPAFALTLAAKDARLVGEAGRAHDVDLPLARAIAQRFARPTRPATARRTWRPSTASRGPRTSASRRSRNRRSGRRGLRLERTPIGRAGLLVAAEAAQQLGAGGVQVAVAVEGERVDERERRARARRPRRPPPRG